MKNNEMRIGGVEVEAVLPRVFPVSGGVEMESFATKKELEQLSDELSEEIDDALDVKIVNHTATTVEIAPNVLNVWGEVAELDITLAPGKEGVCNEYMIEFVSGEKATTLILPAEIRWVALPQIQANKIYQISILNNLAVCGEFEKQEP